MDTNDTRSSRTTRSTPTQGDGAALPSAATDGQPICRVRQSGMPVGETPWIEVCLSAPDPDSATHLPGGTTP